MGHFPGCSHFPSSPVGLIFPAPRLDRFSWLPGYPQFQFFPRFPISISPAPPRLQSASQLDAAIVALTGMRTEMDTDIDMEIEIRFKTAPS